VKYQELLEWVAVVLLVVGGLNWGLVGLVKLDLVATLFGTASLISNVVYILVGLSALYVAWVYSMKVVKK
jgi:uncharacterized membrane protein YuzA (DUF378 family)